MINFWASWCSPCEEEAPYLKLIYEKYEGQFDLYAVNITNKDNLKNVKNFVNQYKLPFPILLDNEGDVQDLYRTSLFPTSFLIDRNGNVMDVINLLDPKELEKKITKLIND